MSSRDFYCELRKRAAWRFEQLSHCKCEIENKVYDDKYELFVQEHEQREAGATPNPALGRLLHHLDCTIGNTFRYTLLIGVCSVLEESVKAIAEEHFLDKAKWKNILNCQERKNWLQKHIHLFSNLEGFELSELLQTGCDQFSDIITLRNCIGHSWGNVEGDRHPDQVRKGVEQIQVRAKVTNTYLAFISTDGYLFLGENMVSDALNLAEDVLDGICSAMLNTLPPAEQ